jgi:hypothetical protein
MVMVRTRAPWLIAGAVAVAVTVGIVLLQPFGGPTRPDRDGTVEIVVDRYRFEPDVISIPSGEPVTLRFTNENDFIYHLSFGREPLETEGVPTGFAEDLFADISARADPPRAWQGPTATVDAVTVNLYERSTSAITVTLPDDRVGSWEAGCFVGRGCAAELQEAFTIIVE